MELKTRRVHFAGCTTSPHEAWMKQMARTHRLRRRFSEWKIVFDHGPRHKVLRIVSPVSEQRRHQVGTVATAG
jgi:hypothetical protein